MKSYYLFFHYPEGNESDVSHELDKLFKSWLREESLRCGTLNTFGGAPIGSLWAKAARSKALDGHGKKGFGTPRSGAPVLGDEIIWLDGNSLVAQTVNDRTRNFLRLLNANVLLVRRKFFNNLMTGELELAGDTTK